MDEGLVGWARAVKRRRGAAARHAGLPVLWLFTDAARLPDPLGAIARLPPGLCGVVFRHDGVAGRAALAARVARCCRARGIPLVVAGDARLAAALGAGVHLRGGHWPGVVRVPGLRTASAHDAVSLRRAARAADIVFLSPAFATASHPRALVIGPARWARLARRRGVYALGGVAGSNIRRLGRGCAGAGAIGALQNSSHFVGKLKL